jgi:hypothetical protein
MEPSVGDKYGIRNSDDYTAKFRNILIKESESS